MYCNSVVSVALAVATCLLPLGAAAQPTLTVASTFHNFAVRGPNSLNFGSEARVELGAFGTNTLAGYATLDPSGNTCPAGQCVALSNQGSTNLPQLAFGTYIPRDGDINNIYQGAWTLRLNVGASTGTFVTPALPLTDVRFVPFASNLSLASSADGKVHTFVWSTVAGVDSTRLSIWDRSGMPASPAQFVRSVTFAGAIATYTIDLNEVGTPFANDRPYTLEVSLIDTRDNNVLEPGNANSLSRSRAYFDFVLPSTPLTTEPVPLSSGGTVATGTAQGAATADQPSAASITVPSAAVVSVSLVPGPEDTDLPADYLGFWRIRIPDPSNPSSPLYFGVGTHWYDRDAKSKLIVNTLRLDKSEIGSGNGTIRDALLILKERLYYKPDQPTARAPADPPEYRQLHLCFVTSGPYPGEPCVLYAKAYTKFNLPKNVPNPNEYLGDHEWAVLANENGRMILR